MHRLLKKMDVLLWSRSAPKELLAPMEPEDKLLRSTAHGDELLRSGDDLLKSCGDELMILCGGNTEHHPGHTLKHCQEQQYFMGRHIRAGPPSRKINTLQVQAVKKETSMKCCRHRLTIFRRKECNSRRRRSMPPIFPLKIRGSVSGKHFRIGCKHNPSSFSYAISSGKTHAEPARVVGAVKPGT